MVSVAVALRVLGSIKKEKDIKKLFSHYPSCYNKLYGCLEENRNLPLKEVICSDCAARVTSYCMKYND